jgi:membrane-associated phospholipid phosphatase
MTIISEKDFSFLKDGSRFLKIPKLIYSTVKYSRFFPRFVIVTLLIMIVFGKSAAMLHDSIETLPSPLYSFNEINSQDSLHFINTKPATLHWYDMITNIPGDWVRYGKETFRTEKIPEYAVVAATTTALVFTDNGTWRTGDKWYRSSSSVKWASDFFTEMGDGRSQFGLAGAFAAYGLIAGDNRAVRTGSEIVEAVLASGGVVQILKHITGRESPFVSTEPAGVWRFFPNQIKYHKKVPHYDAFPSGHLTTSLVTVIVVAENYPELTWIRPVGYALCGLISISMVNTGIHWYSDYPLAIALGSAFGEIVAYPEGETVAHLGTQKKNPVSIGPFYNGSEIGFDISLSL